MGARVVVIGSGLAGAAAALSAAKSGADVTVISKGGGASLLWSGAADICGDPIAPVGRPDLVCREVKTNLKRLIVNQPHHPYSIIAGGEEGNADEILELVRDGIDLVFGGASISTEGGPEKNRAWLTALGTVKFSAMAMSGTAAFDSAGMERPLAVKVAGHLDFDPEAWCKVASETAASMDKKMEPASAMISVIDSVGLNSTGVAFALGREPGKLGPALKDALSKNKGATSIVLAPVLPALGREELLKNLRDELSVPVYELVSMPPSNAGIGLVRSIESALKDAGVRLSHGEVTGFNCSDGAVTGVEVSEKGESIIVAGDAFVLCSGKYLGGGIDKDPRFGEALFDLPVRIGDMVVDDAFIGKVSGLRVNERHGFLEAGVSVDARMLALGIGGEPAFTNLFAAGSVVSGYNYVLDGTGTGAALSTGVVAGREASTISG